MFRAVGHCACASLWTCACVSLCLYVCAYVGCVAVSIRPYFCVYVPAPCLCWLTLGRSQEAPAKTTQHDQQGPLHNRLHSAADAWGQQYSLFSNLWPFHQLPIFRPIINDDITYPDCQISPTVNIQNH